jgi:hypothetical protein
MHKTDVVGVPGNSQPARSAGRFGFVRGFAWLAMVLVMTPAAVSIADQAKAPTPAAPPSAAPPAAPAAPPSAAPPAAPAAPPSAAPPAAPAPSRDITLQRIDVYGTMISAVRTFGKVRKVTSAKFTSLVATSSDPLPIGQKGTLFRKIEKAGDPAATTWVKVAEVTLKKVDAANRIDIDVNLEVPDVLVDGKKSDHFARNAKVKLQLDIEVPQKP